MEKEFLITAGEKSVKTSKVVLLQKRDSVQIFYLGTFMAKYISGGHIPEHAPFKASSRRKYGGYKHLWACSV